MTTQPSLSAFFNNLSSAVSNIVNTGANILATAANNNNSPIAMTSPITQQTSNFGYSDAEIMDFTNNLSYDNFDSWTEGCFTYMNKEDQDIHNKDVAQERIAKANAYIQQFSSRDEADLTVLSSLTCLMNPDDGAILSQLIDTDGDGLYDSIEYYDVDEETHSRFLDKGADGVMDTTTEFKGSNEEGYEKTTYSLDESENKTDIIESKKVGGESTSFQAESALLDSSTLR